MSSRRRLVHRIVQTTRRVVLLAGWHCVALIYRITLSVILISVDICSCICTIICLTRRPKCDVLHYIGATSTGKRYTCTRSSRPPTQHDYSIMTTARQATPFVDSFNDSCRLHVSPEPSDLASLSLNSIIVRLTSSSQRTCAAPTGAGRQRSRAPDRADAIG